MIRIIRTLGSSIITPIKISVRNSCFPANFLTYLKSMPTMEYSKLPNGLNVVTEERECCNVCIGYFFDCGSRYEDPDENGVSHFFEHLAFKGTAARNKTVLEHQISCTGARFKCFTTREMVGFYAECMCEDIPTIFDILTDCLYNNPLSTAEIELQKHIVYKEMIEHDKDTKSLVDDYLHATAFQGTPLGQTVMGPSHNLYKFNPGTIGGYREKTIDPTRTVLAAVGGIKHEQILQLATCLSGVSPSKCLAPYPYRYTGSEMSYRNDTLPVAHVAIAVEGPQYTSPDNLVMTLAATIVGGWDKSQAGGLDASTRVARCASTSQFCESYKSFNITYKDTGLWGVQFIADKLIVDDMVGVVQDEWMRLCTMVTAGEVERAKAELMSKYLTNSQSTAKTCRYIAKWILYNKYKTSLFDQLCAIDAIKVQNIRDTCSKYLYDKCPAVTAIGATECMPEYNRVRAGMYWLRY